MKFLIVLFVLAVNITAHSQTQHYLGFGVKLYNVFGQTTKATGETSFIGTTFFPIQ